MNFPFNQPLSSEWGEKVALVVVQASKASMSYGSQSLGVIG